jgi:hypothetical protein
MKIIIFKWATSIKFKQLRRLLARSEFQFRNKNEMS